MMKKALNHEELKSYQPNRYPFLMIDRVTDHSPGEYAYGFKNLTHNEWYFPVHFPGGANMPGALQLEAMAQMLTVALTTIPGLQGKITHALEHNVRFRQEVVPGDQLVIKAKVNSWKRGICKGEASCTVDDKLVSDAKMIITIPEILEQYIPRSNNV